MSQIANLFLVGAPKSGTTFLFDLLKPSPAIFCPENKEPAYFLVADRMVRFREADVRPPSLVYGRKEYEALYATATNETYRIDASTHYLSSTETAERIKAAAPDSRIVAVLREPVSRAFSHYLMGIRDGYITESFEEALAQEDAEMSDPTPLWAEHFRILRRSLYLDGLHAYLKAFGPDRVRVYLFSDLKEDPDWLVNDLGEFLGIDLSHSSQNAETANKNAYAEARFPRINRMVARYRTSRFRLLANRILPPAARRFLREKFDAVRLKQAAKPQITAEQRDMLKTRLGEDYRQAIELATETGILKRPAKYHSPS